MRVNRVLKWLVAAAILVVGAFLLWTFSEDGEIDSCLDAGGSWHKDRGVCDYGSAA